MNWDNFQNHGNSHQRAFETMCVQIFETHYRQELDGKITHFQVNNDSGGDGGVEAFFETSEDEVIGLQAKWHRTVLRKSKELKQIEKSITSAMRVRSNISKYIICIPHEVHSKTIKKGGVLTSNPEDTLVKSFTKEIEAKYRGLKLAWWFEHEIDQKLLLPYNEHIRKYWFTNEVISFETLQGQFELAKEGWLKERYVPSLNGKGKVFSEYEKLSADYKAVEKGYQKIFTDLKQLQSAIELTDYSIEKNLFDTKLTEELSSVLQELKRWEVEFKELLKATKESNGYYQPKLDTEYQLYDAYIHLNSLGQSDLQRPILNRLPNLLLTIHQWKIIELVSDYAKKIKKHRSLIIGAPGTGKTQGLAFAVSSHLSHGQPAIIIRAKGTPCSDWTEILTHTLKTVGWSLEEILGALSALATKAEFKENLRTNLGTVLICIDGIEEDSENMKEWVHRISESKLLIKRFPRLRFIFSSRNDVQKHITNSLLDERELITLAKEGDTPVWDLAPIYFAKENYNIIIKNPSIIGKIENPIALRLFAELYKDTCIDEETNNVLLSTKDLLYGKLDLLEKEFREKYLKDYSIGSTRLPVQDALTIIAGLLYEHPEIEHNELVTDLSTLKYLNNPLFDNILDLLVEHGFLIRIREKQKGDFLDTTRVEYTITNQSFIDIIISSKIYSDIVEQELDYIPRLTRKKSFEELLETSTYGASELYNNNISKDIVEQIFRRTGKLIGDDGYLTKGFNDSEVIRLRLAVLATVKKGTPEHLKREDEIRNLFIRDVFRRGEILEHLILPSARNENSAFGAGFLHSILSSSESVFERDKIWSDLDAWEKGNLDENERYQYETRYCISSIFSRTGFYLWEGENWNNTPMIFAWGLSSINQKLRDEIRTALTRWALTNQKDFCNLLDRFFPNSDPQILQDLATVALGVACKSSDKVGLKQLSTWILKNVFTGNTSPFYDPIVRYGFRALLERAYDLGVISEMQVRKGRPNIRKRLTLLSPDTSVLGAHDGTYPITHDLAWYVMDDAYKDFFKTPFKDENQCTSTRNTEQARKMLSQYNSKFGISDARTLAFGLAFDFIKKKMGLTRSEGNGFTEARQGSKSSVFTYEEKYTWLAVNHIRGYFSDYLPLNSMWSSGNKYEFISDYGELDTPLNPANGIRDFKVGTDFRDKKRNWIIPEKLTEEFKVLDTIEEDVRNWVRTEPKSSLTRWLDFADSSQYSNGSDSRLLNIQNYTHLIDSADLVHSYIFLRAAIIPLNELSVAISHISENPSHYFERLDSFAANPVCNVYTNPADVIWMDWINEAYSSEVLGSDSMGKPIKIYKAVTSVTTDSIDGESYSDIPSKKLRHLLGINRLDDNELLDAAKNVRGLVHRIRKSYNEEQHIITLEKDHLLERLSAKNETLIWLVEIFRSENHQANFPEGFYARSNWGYVLSMKNGKISNEGLFHNEIRLSNM